MGRKPGKATVTPAELRILQILGNVGVSTVKEVHEEIQKSQDVGYTSVLKTLQLMHAKGLVDRDDTSRSHTYRANAVSLESKRSWLNDVVQSVFRGSPSELLLHAVDPAKVSKSDIDELQRVVDQLRADADGGQV